MHKKTWEFRLRATVSLAVLCLALPQQSPAQLVSDLPVKAPSSQDNSLVIGSPAPGSLPWLAHKTALTQAKNPYQQKLMPQQAMAADGAHYMPHQPSAQPQRPASPFVVTLHPPKRSAQKTTVAHDEFKQAPQIVPQHESPGHSPLTAVVLHAPHITPQVMSESLPDNVYAQATFSQGDNAATALPWQPVSSAVVAELSEPIHAPLPALFVKKSILDLAFEPVKTSDAPAKPHAEPEHVALAPKQPKPEPKLAFKTTHTPVKTAIALAANKNEAHLSVPSLAAVAQAAPVLLTPPHETTEPKLVSSDSIGVKNAQLASVSHDVWRDDRKLQLAVRHQQEQQNVLTPAQIIRSADAHTVTTKTVVAKLETDAQQTIEPAITGQAFSEQEMLAQMAPAAGGNEPTVLMPPKVPMPPVADAATAALPKLDLPQGANASIAVAPDNSVTIVPAAPQPRLSEESKGILERLPAEPHAFDTKKPKHVSIERSARGVASKEDDIKKHEAYGMKIAVKRPKMDVFRTLESAYNSLIAGDQQYAITQYKEVLNEDPENTMALFGLATTYHRAGQLKMARPLYSQLLDIDPQNVEGLNNFLVLLSDESPQEALVELQRLQHSHPSFSPVPAQMALIYEKEGEYSKAAEKMAQALSLSPENIKFQYDMAIIYDKMGDWTEAAKWYQRLISADERGEKLPGKTREIQQRLTFIRSNTGSHSS